MQTKKCIVCQEDRDEKHFPKSKWICYRCRGLRERSVLKLRMLEAFGWKCQCCGEDNPFFLTLDHVKNDGASHRDQGYNEQQIYRIAQSEGWPKDRYQLLCMNCNFAKGHFQECPHVLGLTTEAAIAQLQHNCRLVGRVKRPMTEAQRAGLAKGHEISHVFGRSGQPKPDLLKMLAALEALKKPT